MHQRIRLIRFGCHMLFRACLNSRRKTIFPSPAYCLPVLSGLLIFWASFGNGTALASSSETRADENDPVEIQLLQDKWESGQANRKATKQLVEKLDRTKARPDLAYAVGLSLIRHSEYIEAIEWLQLASMTDESNLNARRASTWLFARTKQHNRSLEELSLLLKAMNESAEDLSAEERSELVRFSGRIMGFYAGPASDSIKSSTLDRYSRRVFEQLKDGDLDAFNKARSEVTGDFTDLEDEQGKAKEEALERGLEEQERLKEELEKRQVDLREEREVLSKAYQSMSDEASEALRSIRDRDQPLALRITRLEQRAISLDTELGLIRSDIFRLRQLASREQDRFLRDRLNIEADRLIITASRIDADLIATRREIGLVAAQRRQVLAELQRTESNYQRSLGNLENRIEANAKMQTRTSAELTRVLRGPKVESGRTLGLGARANAITTYEEFPLESERRELLAKFRAEDE